MGLLSIGEEPTKGTPLVKETHGLLAAEAAHGTGFEFVGNLEGRDLLPSPADVIVTDGFTGNVALKTLEGSLRFLFDTMLGVFGTDDATREAAEVLLPHLLPAGGRVRARRTPAGPCCSGTDGVCVISHGSSNATAMMNAVLVAHECADAGPGRPGGGGRAPRRTRPESPVQTAINGRFQPRNTYTGRACRQKPTPTRAPSTATGSSS